MTASKLIVANWKMNGSLASIRDYGVELARRMEKPPGNAQLVIAPPFPYLMFMDGRLASAAIGLAAQDCSAKAEKGAFTGDVSAVMLKDIGCQYVIVGHSERRQYFQESNTIVAAKVQCAIEAGLIPILCVGETLEEKEAGTTENVVKTQLDAVKLSKELIIAYEPVWSIGTGRVPTAKEITSMCIFIQDYAHKKNIPTTVVYGGSVNGDNAREILHLKGVDGVLVGGASLTLDTFWPIVMAAD
jgi:triosephosphate isomerase